MDVASLVTGVVIFWAIGVVFMIVLMVVAKLFNE